MFTGLAIFQYVVTVDGLALCFGDEVLITALAKGYVGFAGHKVQEKKVVVVHRRAESVL